MLDNAIQEIHSGLPHLITRWELIISSLFFWIYIAFPSLMIRDGGWYLSIVRLWLFELPLTAEGKWK